MIIDTLKTKFPSITSEVSPNDDIETFCVERSQIVDVLKFLKNFAENPFDLFLDLCGVDYKGSETRFEVVYHLYSMAKKNRVRIKVKVPENDCHVPSVVSVYPIADWFEREAWDMFGIRFDGHPNLQRLLMWEGFEGHPLRKDYPINKRQPIPTLGNLL